MPILPTESLESAVQDALTRARAARDAFCSLGATTDPTEAVQAFDRIGLPIDRVRGWCSLYAMAHPEDSVRERCEACVRQLSAFGTELSLDTELFAGLLRLEGATGLDAEERRLVTQALRDFRRSGVDREQATRERVTALRAELVELGQTFDRNIVEGGREVRFEGGHDDLAGLPEDFLAAHPQAEDGSVTLSTDPSVRAPFLTYQQDEGHRRKYLEAALSRATPENLEVLPKLIARRAELAGLLGYSSWADYVTEENMSRSGANVRTFLEDLVARLEMRRGQELDEYLELKREVTPDAQDVQEWDRFFLLERGRRERCGADSREARRYFPVRETLQGCLETVERVFAVEIAREPQAAVWHESVEAFAVLRDGQVVARFYLDLYPRDGKFKHACMSSQHQGLSGLQIPEASLLCNFTRATESDPGYMAHEQVTTLFHEFGHLMHHLLAGEHRFLAFSGISTEWDFVEVPSQFFEEWAWEPEVLQRFAKHPETAEPIPTDMIERMRRADEYGKAIEISVQLTYALLSLSLYEGGPAAQDPLQVMLGRKREAFPFPHVEGTAFVASFGHLHGYSAMYYTYLWSLAIAKDLREAFDGRLLDRELGARYVKQILAPGGSKDAADLVAGFLGRESNSEAFERWLAR